jgi:hypothetical protein
MMQNSIPNAQVTAKGIFISNINQYRLKVPYFIPRAHTSTKEARFKVHIHPPMQVHSVLQHYSLDTQAHTTLALPTSTQKPILHQHYLLQQYSYNQENGQQQK